MEGPVDLLIVGGGLAGTLLALALAERRPELRVVLLEAGTRLGGNHLWSFFDTDVARADRWLVDALVCHRWPDYEVRFPGFTRRLDQPYQSIESDRLHDVALARLPTETVRLGTAVRAVAPDHVVLADGARLAATGVIDARGMVACPAGIELGWQKFAGQLLCLRQPHGLARPVVMDATVDQAEGYRFVYLLPFGPREVFVEDTYYRSDPALDPAVLAGRIGDYAAERGWEVVEVGREEAAALPITIGGRFDAWWPAAERVPRIGMAAGLFQPMTGYSLPDAVRTASLLAATPDFGAAALLPLLRGYAETAWNGGNYYRLLARLLFHAADPAERWRVLARFYRLDPHLIERFYAGNSTHWDRVRLLAGRPPVPLGRAVAALKEHMA